MHKPLVDIYINPSPDMHVCEVFFGGFLNCLYLLVSFVDNWQHLGPCRSKLFDTENFFKKINLKSISR